MMTLKEYWEKSKIQFVFVVLLTYGVPILLFIKGWKPMWREIDGQPEGLFISLACYVGGYLWYRAAHAWFGL